MKFANNKKGIVLAVVLMVIIVMMILSVSILSISMNQATQSQDKVEHIKMEQIAKGVLWDCYSKPAGCDTGTQNIGPINGRTYVATITNNAGTYTIKID